MSIRKSLSDIKDWFQRHGDALDVLTDAPEESSAGAGTAAIRPYKVYSALLSQAGTADPVATVLENSIGAIVLTRTSAGEYAATLAGAFTADKTAFFAAQPAAGGPVDADVIQIVTSAQDDQLGNTFIEIRVYP